MDMQFQNAGPQILIGIAFEKAGKLPASGGN